VRLAASRPVDPLRPPGPLPAWCRPLAAGHRTPALLQGAQQHPGHAPVVRVEQLEDDF
jgi:hypothetical protein